MLTPQKNDLQPGKRQRYFYEHISRKKNGKSEEVNIRRLGNWIVWLIMSIINAIIYALVQLLK